MLQKFGWACGLPGLALIVGVATPLLAPRMERRLDDRAGAVVRATTEAGLEPWLRLTVRGRDLIAAGEAPDEAGRVAALDRLKRLPGLRHVVGRIGIVEDASPFVWTATRTSPERIELSGSRPVEIGPSALAAKLAPELPSETRIIDQAKAARGAPPDFSAASAFALEQLKPLAPGASATIADTTVSFSGEALTVAGYEEVRQALSYPPTGFTMGKVDIRPAAIPDFQFAVTRERGGNLVLSGNVVSEAAREDIRAMADAAADGASVDDRMQTARGLEEGIDPTTLSRFAFRISSLLQDGRVTYADSRLSVSGTALDGQAIGEIDALLRDGRPSGTRAGPVDLAAMPLSPYRFMVRRESDAVTLTGHLPDSVTRDRILATLRPRFFRERIVDKSRVAEGAPADLAGAVEAGITSLAMLATGEIRLSDRSLALTGNSLYRESAGRYETDLARRMPAGWRVQAEVKPPPGTTSDDPAACRSSFERATQGSRLVFAPGSVTLRAEFYPTLDAVASAAKACPGLRIEVIGHGDPAGVAGAPKPALDAGVENTASVDSGKARDGDKVTKPATAKADKPAVKPADPKPASVKDGKDKATRDKATRDKAAGDKAAKEKDAKADAPKEAKPAEPEPDLARQRALVVVEYLLQAGIPADRIVAAPAGRANAIGQGVGLALRS
ncbi:BON domain-containing protein [Methylobacterium sp. E-045]|uniref:BON domain-containing protein n=1 Tax=Methylobacterium sp. E-045 TaxID=2836575 RepID=UPI001FBB47D9|nr:BON domain-containing protein [Methylobacterium sp. E-045]MCJ2131817.1 BON domain-containing protein [Methylobacterium sp. E-045]